MQGIHDGGHGCRGCGEAYTDICGCWLKFLTPDDVGTEGACDVALMLAVRVVEFSSLAGALVHDSFAHDTAVRQSVEGFDARLNIDFRPKIRGKLGAICRANRTVDE